jgi:uncharacterized membrane protein YgdD (TMEM256/DUF423 family)
MRFWRVMAGFLGLMGMVGATLYAHARPIPALGQAAFVALFHAPVLLWLSDRRAKDFLAGFLPLLFTVGGMIFTGSIYLKYLGGVERATVIAPAGGTMLILGWLGLMLRSGRRWE